MVATKRQQITLSWKIVFRTTYVAVILCLFSLARLATFSDCGHDENHKVDQRLLNGPQTTAQAPYSLASRQSYGFFDDIVDDSWKLMQERARSSVNYIDRAQLERDHKYPGSWYMQNLQVRIHTGTSL